MEFLIYMCNWGLRRRAPLPAGKIGTPSLMHFLVGPENVFCESCWRKFFGWSILFIIYEAKTTAESVCTVFFKLFHSLAILLKNISKFHWFCFGKASNELRCFSYPSNAMAPYTPFLSIEVIEVDIVHLLSSFFHSIPPLVGFAGRKERSNLCNSLA